MSKLSTWLFGRSYTDRNSVFDVRDAPILPTPDTGPVRASLPPEPGANALQPLKNWSHPFNDQRNPLQQLTHLAKATAGYYPLGINGLWHGGVHFDSGTADGLDQSSVQCLADGEVVAYRIDTRSPTTAYWVHKLSVKKPFSRNFVLVRHRLQPPKIEGSPDTPPSLTFYSLYLHLQDWAVYQEDPALARPAFWPEAAVRRVKATVNDVRPGQPTQRGLNVRNQAAWRGTVLDLLPQGAEVTVSGEGDYRKLENTLAPAKLTTAEGSLRGYVSITQLRQSAGNEYHVATRWGSLNVRAEPSFHSAVLEKLPDGTKVTVSGEGEYRKLEHINQYVHFKSLQGALEPLAQDRVVVLDSPVAIKAGELIGHLGRYQDCHAERPEKKLHLEVFSGDDIDLFIEASRAWAQRLPDKDRTWLKLAQGTAVVTHQENATAAQLKMLSAASPLSAADLLVLKSLLDGLSADRKIQVAASGSRKASNWYRLDGLLHDADNKLLDGWVREEVGVTPWLSPWSWEGYDVIFDYSTPKHAMASFLSAVDHFSEAQRERYRPLADKDDQGPMKSRLYDIIDRNRDGKMTAEELQAVLHLPAHAQAISQLIIRKESEWFHQTQKWDALDELLGHGGSTPHLNWLAEKQRIEQLSWWGEVAEKVGLPSWGKVYHFHPVGLLGTFSIANPLEITHEQLKQIFPAADDDDIDVVLNEINGRLAEFKLDTRLRQCHFFAQIKGEVGTSMKGVTESWEYSPTTLKSFSVYYRAHPAEAEEDGYLKDAQGRFVRRANQREIGRKHFQRLNGNRDSHPDDGYNLRGRGLIQITGYEKYHGYMRDYNKYWAGVAPDTVSNPELIGLMPNAIRSALWFWLYKEPYVEDRGRGLSDVRGVTRIVNGGATGLDDRELAYVLIEGILK